MSTVTHQPSRIIFPDAHPIDLNRIMRQVYVWMGLGTLLTAITAFVTVNTKLINIALNPIAMIIAILVELGMVLGLSFGIQRLSTGMALFMFFAYAALNGFTLSMILLEFNIGTIFTAFLATAILFGVMTVFAFTTSMDLSKLGTYMTMGVVGLVIAIVVNMFVNSNLLSMLISMIGVLVFTGLTAYDIQAISQMATRMSDGEDHIAKFGLMGALKLYLDFINMFLFMLRLIAGSRSR